MRIAVVGVLVMLVGGLPVFVHAQAPVATAPVFGAGEPLFAAFEVPGAENAPEPTIGIPWTSDSVFFHAGSTTLRARFAQNVPDWMDVTPPYQVPINLDPMLHADPDSGRVWAGGLHGACSVMMMSDDDGATWIPAGNMCSGLDFDHQSIGAGPPVGAVDLERPYAYYCGQGGTISCAFSVDGGQSWGPFQQVPGPCGGFHGHIRTDPQTGFAAVPVAACGDQHGLVSSADGGLTWRSHQIPGSHEWTNGFDPSLQFTRGSGWLYYGMASEHGIHVALSKDHGETWEEIGGGMGVTPSTWFEIGRFHDPPIVAGTFADVQAGDDDRVAISFLGIEGGPDADLELLNSERIFMCDEDQEKIVWHYYTAFSYDAGATWSVHKLTADPAQVGGMYDVLVTGSGDCRNLLDFNDNDIDSEGRLHIGWADGCVRECAATSQPETDGYRERVGKLFRQVGGMGLLAAHDTEAPANTTATPSPEPTGRSTPAVPLALLVGALVGLLAWTRRP